MKIRLMGLLSLAIMAAMGFGCSSLKVAEGTLAPPKWVADMGLEWLVRLAVEPARLWRRYVLGLPVFGWRVLASS